MHLLAVSTLMATLLTVEALAPPQFTLNGWYPCDYSTSDLSTGAQDLELVPFQCGKVEVPLCYDGVCDSAKTISIFIKRLLANATDERAHKAVWFLNGGPGGSSNSMEDNMVLLHEHLDFTVDMYTMDHRGTGRSFFLQCEAAQAFSSGSPSGIALHIEEYPSCLQDILMQIDQQSAAFSVTSAAKDLEYLITELNTDQDVYVYGSSYGTYLAERLIHLEPSAVKGYMLDGVVPEDDPTFSSLNENRVYPATKLAEYCAENTNCTTMFEDWTSDGTSMYDAWLALYSELDAIAEGENPCVDLVRNVSTLTQDAEYIVSNSIKLLFQDLMHSVRERRKIPAVLNLIHRCLHAGDFYAVADALGIELESDDESESSTGKPPQAFDVVGESSPFLHQLIKVSEMWAWPSPSWEENLERVHSTALPSLMKVDYRMRCILSGNVSDPACGVLYDSSILDTALVPFFYEPDEYHQTVATLPRHASALIFNGKLDFKTPSQGGVRQYEKMTGGSGKMMVNFDFGPHCAGAAKSTVDDTTRCGYRIMASYVNADGDVAAVDTSCMEELPSMTFYSADGLVEQYLEDQTIRRG